MLTVEPLSDDTVLDDIVLESSVRRSDGFALGSSVSDNGDGSASNEWHIVRCTWVCFGWVLDCVIMSAG